MAKSNRLICKLFLIRYWSYDDEYCEWTQEGIESLPSDSVNRQDLKSLKEDDYLNAQKFKDELENEQRYDKQLREKNKSK